MVIWFGLPFILSGDFNLWYVDDAMLLLALFSFKIDSSQLLTSMEALCIHRLMSKLASMLWKQDRKASVPFAI